MTFPEFLAKWTNPPGKRIDFDHVFGYQCVDLVLEYLYQEYGLSGIRGNAIDYWNKTSAPILKKFVKVQSQVPHQGDITILTSPSTKFGHIGIATGRISGGNFEMMEQNGGTGDGKGTGTDAIRTRYVSKSRIVGLLRPIATVPATPMITLVQLTELYHDLLRRGPDAGGIQHYVDHYTYDFARQDLLNSAEYKNLKARQAAAAAAEAAAAAQSAAKAAQQSTLPPAGPAMVPTSTIKYPINRPIETFGSMTDATNHTSPKGEIQPGAIWYQYCEKGGMLNITQTPGATSGTWINPADNVLPAPIQQPDPIPTSPDKVGTETEPPVERVTDILHSFMPIMPDGSPIECGLLQSVMAVDALGTGLPVIAVKGEHVRVYGTHMAAGHTFATVKSSDKIKQSQQLYGILITARDNFAPYLSDPYTFGERLQVNWELIYDKLYKTIDGVFRAVTRKKK